ncbi:MAG: 3-keto-5-aminohexanoate cleavage protein [Alphaproteobacteria bacterium]|nr:3-keto-5-aminohexanoate cleavage protein [Alphaproteobacteria bacterium]MCB9796344.1 3-keto-5-aminohexanoate cleavage protein [Alphaproteobacteria bacterium]
MSQDKLAVITCALTGVLTNPQVHPVPVTPAQMAAEARRAFDAGATVMHCHFRRQEEGLGHLPTWEPEVVEEIAEAIRQACPGVILNFSTGVVGPDISGPVACLQRSRPEVAALNAGSLNYLKVRRGGQWAWPPMLFDNPVEKISGFLDVMKALRIVPECECFDTGIVRSVDLMRQAGLLPEDPHVSFVMGVASGMPAKASWLPLLIEELSPQAHWQAIVIGRAEVWDVHRATAELGGHLRTGLEDTFYLPSGEKASSNGELVEALAAVAREAGREVASPAQARAILGTREAA